MASVMVIPVFIPHRGCPHHCSFCNQNIITAGSTAGPGKLPDAGDLDRIISEYLQYRGDRRRVELAFFGGNFLGLPEKEIFRLLQAAAPWLERGEIQSLRCSTRPDTITHEILEKIRPLGLTLVELGVQSMDEEVLARSGRGHTRQDTLTAVAALKAAGINVGVQLITGLPADTREKSLETARQVAALKPDLARIYPVLVLKGSALAKAFRDGTYTPQTLVAAVETVKEMVKLLEGEGVPVVRMGLQAGEGLEDGGLEDQGTILAGPWHPAFGHLVRSALMLERVRSGLDDLLKKDVSGKAFRIELTSHPRSVSRLRGDKNANLAFLERTYPGMAFRVRTDPDLAVDGVGIRVLP